MLATLLFPNPSFIGTNYTSIVFANAFLNDVTCELMFTSVYAALEALSLKMNLLSHFSTI